MKQRSVMDHNFAQVSRPNLTRTRFQRNHGVKTTFDSGYLIPFLCDEILPGEAVTCKFTGFVRLLTPITPFMDNLHLETFFFFVPDRILWDKWKRFMGEQAKPSDSIDFMTPVMTSPSGTGYAVGSIHDYFGLPVNVPGIVHLAAPLRAYQKIWDDWFRHQDLQDSVLINTGDGPDNPADYKLLKRGKRHDYFTSGLPRPQKGPSVDLPIGGNAPIEGIGRLTGGTFGDVDRSVNETGPRQRTYAKSTDSNAASAWYFEEDPNNVGYPAIWANLDRAITTANTINSLRQSVALQTLFERFARGGSRYTEITGAHFGVQNPDGRLQRPEYLGGGSSPVTTTAIPQTSSTDQTTPQGNLAAYATALAQGHGFSREFTEHGWIIGLLNVRADLTYQRGLHKKWTRRYREDYYFPDLANLGEQAILNEEIWADGSAADKEVFAYNERWSELRYFPSQITGRFRSFPSNDSLDVWHLSQDFQQRPALNAVFIEEDPPVKRVIAVQNQPEFKMDGYLEYSHVRQLPMFSTPGFVGSRL